MSAIAQVSPPASPPLSRKVRISQIIPDLRQGFENLLLHKLRSLLTMLGMIFGVGAVVAMLSITAGVEKEMLAMIDQLGVNNIIIESREAILERVDVVGDFPDVASLRRRCADLEKKEIAHGRLRSFDTARQHRFAPGKRMDEQVRVWQDTANAAEMPHRSLRRCECAR